MSLQVWLPLNGNLDNYGLSNVSVTNNGATVNDYGKIGKCYSFNGSTNNLSFTPKVDGLSTFSICLWLCPSSSTPSGVFFSLERDTYWQVTFVNNTIGIRDNSVGYSGSRKNFSTGTYAANTWTHLAVTYDHGTLNIYRDGGLLSTNSVGGTQLNTLINNCRIGSAVQSGYYHSGKINDVRIYDHCLSPKEVKDISKGLVLHYTMDENVQQLNNCFNYPTFNTSTASGGWSHWAPSGSTGSYSQNTDKTYIYNKNQTYSHKVSHLTGTYYICYQSPAFEGGFRSVQAIIKLEDGSNPKGKVSFSHNANVLNKPTEYIELGDGFYLMKKQGFKQDGSNDLVSIYISNNAVVYISEAYLENDREACSDILSLRSNIEHDASGYCNDGVITGTLTLSTDTPRHELSTFISNGLTEYIKTPTINIAGDAITVSMWINSTNTNPTGSYHMPFQSNTNNYVEFSITNSGLFRCGLYVNGTRYVTNISDVNVLDGNWHMLSVTYNGANIKRYIDGILKSTTAISGTLNCTSQLYWIGRRSTTTYAALDMYFSDIRMYTTALSDDDIKELYDTAAFIDNLGNVSCYEFEEQNENLLKYEYTIIGTNTSNTSTRGKYTKRNGVWAMAFKATDTYWSSAYHHVMLAGRFKENTQYVFDLWLDTDNVISGGNNVVGGFTIYYTDNTSTSTLTCTGSQANPKGWQHKFYISTAGKTVSDIIVYYYTSATFYVRADSFIAPVYEAKITSNAISYTSQFIENTDVASIGKAAVNGNSFIEV